MLLFFQSKLDITDPLLKSVITPVNFGDFLEANKWKLLFKVEVLLVK